MAGAGRTGRAARAAPGGRARRAGRARRPAIVLPRSTAGRSSAARRRRRRPRARRPAGRPAAAASPTPRRPLRRGRARSRSSAPQVERSARGRPGSAARAPRGRPSRAGGCRTGGWSRARATPRPAQRRRAAARARRPAIVVAAHYDTVDTPAGFVGANDGAAGTAVVVELAGALRRDAAPGGRRARCASCSSTARRRPATADFLRTGCAARAPTRGRTRGEVGRWSCSTTSAHRGLRLPREGTSDPRAVGAAARGGPRASASARSSRRAPGARIFDDHTPFLDAASRPSTSSTGDYPLGAHAAGHARQDLAAQPRRGRGGGARPGAELRRVLARGAAGRRGPRTHGRRWPSPLPRSSCSPRRAATAPASTARCRRSSARSSSTARRSTCARRSCTTSTSSSSCASAARSSSRSSTTRSPRARSRSSRPTASSPAVHAEAERARLQTIDATCPLVTKVHREAVKFAGEGYTIVLIGHAGHEEVEGTMGEAPEHIVLVETVEDVDALEVDGPREARLHLADDAVGRRDARDHRPPARALPGHHRAAHRRHLLRHDEPPGGGQADGAALRPRARDRLAQLVELQPPRRGRARARRRLLPDRQRGPGRRGVARRQARRRHHVGRQRPRGARPAAWSTSSAPAAPRSSRSSRSSRRTCASCCRRRSGRP